MLLWLQHRLKAVASWKYVLLPCDGCEKETRMRERKRVIERRRLPVRSERSNWIVKKMYRESERERERKSVWRTKVELSAWASFSTSKGRQLMQEHVVLGKQLKSTLRKLVMTTNNRKSRQKAMKKKESKRDWTAKLMALRRSTYQAVFNGWTQISTSFDVDFVDALSLAATSD